MIDDLRGMSAWQKLLGQLLAAGVAFGSGVQVHAVGGWAMPRWMELPATLAWLVLITNAVNLIDGMDGLATGVTLFAMLTILTAGLQANNIPLAMAVVRLAGALLEGFLFRFSGGGPPRAEVESAPGDLAWCRFQGYHRREELEGAFGENDIGLVTQRAATVGTVVSSKVYGVMAAGRGLLYVGTGRSTVGRMIGEHGVGWQVENGDMAGLRMVLERLWARPEEVEETGRRARVVFEREFERRGQVRKIWRVLEGMGHELGTMRRAEEAATKV